MAERYRQKKVSTSSKKQRGVGKPRAKKPTKGSAQRTKDIILFGIKACRAVFEQRPQAINRVCVLRERHEEFSDVRLWCRKNRRSFKEVNAEELRRIAGSEHHEGVVFDIKPKPQTTLEKMLQSVRQLSEPSCIVVLEGVQNPHNIGAIVRTACFFGATGIVVVDSEASALSSAAYRIAEGALEQISVVAESDALSVIRALQDADYALYATTPHKATSLYSITWPSKIAVFFGAERDGLSPVLLEHITNRVVIPRRGILESLNVGAAVASVLTEINRCH